jgi:hypothetical protein
MWQIEAVGRRLRPDCGKIFPTVASPAGIGEGAGSGCHNEIESPSCCKQGCYRSTSESQGGGDSG